MATRQPAAHHGAATRWRLDDLVAALQQGRPWSLSRSRSWRMLDEADLKPHPSVYGLKSHDPACETKAQDMCAFYLNAHRFFAPGRVVLCTEEKTGMPMRQRPSPTPPIAPGKPEKREHEYIRPGVRALLASLMVPTGRVVWNLGQTRTRRDLAAPLAHVVHQLPERQRDDWVVDKLHTPWSLDVCRLVAAWCHVPFVAEHVRRGVQRRAFLRDPTPKHVFHFTPKQGSWLNPVEWWFRGVARRFRKRGACDSAPDCATRLFDSLEVYPTHHAHPYRWTYTGQPLVRATPCSQTRCQQRQGRAWFSSRPKRFARAFYPPRSYKQAAASLAANL